MAITIAVLSQKGGTGKTTMARSLADIFGRIGLHTLSVDADPSPEGFRVRIGMHTGEASFSSNTYAGLNVHRASRRCARRLCRRSPPSARSVSRQVTRPSCC